MEKEKIDPRIIKTRSLLIKALFELLNSENNSHFTIKEICELAGITRQTFYLHFQEKDDLLKEVSEELLEDFRKTINNYEEIDLNFFLIETHPNILRIFQHILNNKFVYEALLVKNPMSPFAVGFKEEIHYFVSRSIDKILEQGLELEAPSEIVIQYTTAAYFDVIIWWIKNGYQYSIEEMTKILLRLSINGPYKNPVI